MYSGRQLGDVAHIAVVPSRPAGGDDLLGLVGQDDHVEGGGEVAGADGGVVEGLGLEAVLLEQEARPALVHRGRPRLVEAHAWRGQRLRARRAWRAAAVQRHAGLRSCAAAARAPAASMKTVPAGHASARPTSDRARSRPCRRRTAADTAFDGSGPLGREREDGASTGGDAAGGAYAAEPVGQRAALHASRPSSAAATRRPRRRAGGCRGRPAASPPGSAAA